MKHICATINRFFQEQFGVGLIVIFIAALVFRLVLTDLFVGLSSPPDGEAKPDQVAYESLAFHVSQGEGFSREDGVPTAARPPGTSIALTPVYLVFGRSWTAGRLWFAIISSASCIAVAWLCALAGYRGTGLVAAAITAFYPGTSYYALHFLSENVYQPLVTLATAATLASLQANKHRYYLIAGLAFGFAVLVRPQAVFMIPFLLFLPFFNPESRAASFKAVATIVTISIAIVIPWLIRNYLLFGVLTFATMTWSTMWGSHNEVILNDPARAGSWISSHEYVPDDFSRKGGAIDVEKRRSHRVAEFVRTHWRDLPYLVSMKFYRLLSPFELTENIPVLWAFAVGWLIISPFAIFGWWTLHRYNPLASQVVLIPFCGLIVTTLVFYGSVRFRHSIAPVTIVLTSIGLQCVTRRVFCSPDPIVESFPNS